MLQILILSQNSLFQLLCLVRKDFFCLLFRISLLIHPDLNRDIFIHSLDRRKHRFIPASAAFLISSTLPVFHRPFLSRPYTNGHADCVDKKEKPDSLSDPLSFFPVSYLPFSCFPRQDQQN